MLGGPGKEQADTLPGPPNRAADNLLHFGWSAYRRFDRNQAVAYKMHRRHAPEDHWYLWAIGVDPGSQGEGIGGRLLQPVLASASASGTPCYLETHNERNVRFYQKHGFRVVCEERVPKGGPRVRAMLRYPGSRSTHTCPAL